MTGRHTRTPPARPAGGCALSREKEAERGRNISRARRGYALFREKEAGGYARGRYLHALTRSRVYGRWGNSKAASQSWRRPGRKTRTRPARRAVGCARENIPAHSLVWESAGGGRWGSSKAASHSWRPRPGQQTRTQQARHAGAAARGVRRTSQRTHSVGVCGRRGGSSRAASQSWRRPGAPGPWPARTEHGRAGRPGPAGGCEREREKHPSGAALTLVGVGGGLRALGEQQGCVPVMVMEAAWQARTKDRRARRRPGLAALELKALRASEKREISQRTAITRVRVRACGRGGGGGGVRKQRCGLQVVACACGDGGRPIPLPLTAHERGGAPYFSQLGIQEQYSGGSRVTIAMISHEGKTSN